MIIIVNVATGQTLDNFAYLLVALTNEQMEVIGHEAIGIYGATGATRQAHVIILNTNPVKGSHELVIVLSILEYVLVIDASHHHMMDACA
jgi:hypothetical protein